MKTLVISLARSLDRRSAFVQANSSLSFEFVDAVDGKALQDKLLFNPLRDRKLFEADLGYTPGAYGCALSHLQLWERCIAQSEPLTVLEDDAVVRSDFATAREATLRTLGDDWDIVVWGWNTDSMLHVSDLEPLGATMMVFDHEGMKTRFGEFQRMTQAPRLMRLRHCFGTPGYSVSPRGAAALKRLCFPLTKFTLAMPLIRGRFPNNGVDIAMSRAYGDLKAFVSLPPLVVTLNDVASSTVQRAGPRVGQA